MNTHSEEVLGKYPRDQLLNMLFEAGIGKDEEVYYVSNIILSHLRNTSDILPLVTEHQGLNLASRSLVSLGFFPAYLEHLNRFHGFPKPGFYFEVCKSEFFKAGKIDLSLHLRDWIYYFNNRFSFQQENKHLILESEEKVKTGMLSRGYSFGDLKKGDIKN
jgi:hypothetical protein